MDMRDTPLKSAHGIMTLGSGKIKGFGPAAHAKIASHFSTFGELLDANEAALIGCTNISQRNTLMQSGQTALSHAFRAASAEIASAAEMGAEPITIYDNRYPVRLKEQPNRPAMFFCAGDISLLERTVAVVGTRSTTDFNQKLTTRLVGAFVEQGWGIVTGMEPGLQAGAHHIALKAGVANGAVLGCGLDQYDAKAESLLVRIGEHGVVLSEQPMGKMSDFGTQTRRYRLVTALSAATLILPCEQDSIEMHAVKYSLLQDRPVIAPAIPPGYAEEPANKALINLTRLSPVQYATLCDWKDEYLAAANECERPTAAEPISSRDDYPFLFSKLEAALSGRMPVQVFEHDIAATFP